MREVYKEKCICTEGKEKEFDNFAFELSDLMKKYGIGYISHNWLSGNPFRISIYNENSIELRNILVRFV